MHIQANVHKYSFPFSANEADHHIFHFAFNFTTYLNIHTCKNEYRESINPPLRVDVVTIWLGLLLLPLCIECVKDEQNAGVGVYTHMCVYEQNAHINIFFS